MSVATAAAANAPAPYEVMQSRVEVEVQPDGSYLESRQTAYRVLTEQGARALRQVTLSYTEGFQSYAVHAAYTLKADGTRVDVDGSHILHGYGATSSPGFQDLQTITIVFPDLEIGDQVVLTTVLNQIRPWFGDSYSEQFIYGSEIPSRDVTVALTAPSGMSLQIDAGGLTQVPAETLGGKTRRVWHYRNDTPTQPEAGAVDDYDRSARLVVSTFKDYRSFAAVYQKMIEGRAEATPDIRALADKLTAGLKSDREQARALYEWVSLHIAYVNIVLGAGGFVPHRAGDVLANRFGDCKDHVILLEALLAAKGIDRSPVLISADDRFTLSPSPSPQAFNHLITYVPELHLYLDSTARYAPFGVLPFSDAGKPVVHIADGQSGHTPAVAPATAWIHSAETVTVAGDGSADGETHVTAAGAPAVELRALIDQVRASGDADYFRQIMGPGVDGTLDGGNVGDLAPTYSYSARYHVADALNIPGPASIPYHIVYKPFAFTTLIVGDLPPSRSQPYVCVSMEAEEDLTIHLPAGLHVIAMPRSGTLSADEVDLLVNFTKTDENTVHAALKAHVSHPGGSCSPAYYARVRAALAQMASALRSEILYQ